MGQSPINNIIATDKAWRRHLLMRRYSVIVVLFAVALLISRFTGVQHHDNYADWIIEIESWVDYDADWEAILFNQWTTDEINGLWLEFNELQDAGVQPSELKAFGTRVNTINEAMHPQYSNLYERLLKLMTWSCYTKWRRVQAEEEIGAPRAFWARLHGRLLMEAEAEYKLVIKQQPVSQP